MRNRGLESRTAVWSSTGILTRPNASEPFHNARGIYGWSGQDVRPRIRWGKTSPIRGPNAATAFGPWIGRRNFPGLAPRSQLAFRVEPVVPVAAVLAAAAQVTLVGDLGDLLVAR